MSLLRFSLLAKKLLVGLHFEPGQRKLCLALKAITDEYPEATNGQVQEALANALWWHLENAHRRREVTNMSDDLKMKIDDHFANVEDEQFLAGLKEAGFTLVPKMTPDQVEQRLREIDERASSASDGPWYLHNPDDDMSMNVFLVSTTPGEPDPWWDGEEEAKKVVAITLLQSPKVASVSDGRWEQNADFIAHAREDVPWLLSLLREREEENRKLRDVLAYLRDYGAKQSELPDYVEQMYLAVNAALRGDSQ